MGITYSGLERQVHRFAGLGAAGYGLAELHVQNPGVEGRAGDFLFTTDGVDELVLHPPVAAPLRQNIQLLEAIRQTVQEMIWRLADPFDSLTYQAKRPQTRLSHLSD